MCVCVLERGDNAALPFFVSVCVSASVRACVSRLAAVARGPLSVALPG